jgi:hypothetical protein
MGKGIKFLVLTFYASRSFAVATQRRPLLHHRLQIGL